MIRLIATIAIVTTFIFSPPAYCNPLQLTVANASNIKWAIQGTRVYFRNLNAFDPDAPPCCYSAWVDLTTDTGRAMFSAFLTKNASGQRVMIYLSDTVDGKISMLGDW